MPDLMQPDISVVICAYTTERWEDLRAAVSSVMAQTLPAREIIVVIDHNDALLERVRAEIRNVITLANAEAKGLAGARNTGVWAATGTIVAFLDDDARGEPGWLANLAPHYARPEVGGVGGLVRPVWSGPHPSWWPAEFNWVVGCSYVGLPQVTALVRNFIGANMSFRRNLFDEAGGFRTGIGRVDAKPVGCEETELCIRAHQLRPSLELVYEPLAVVHHRVTPERATWRYFRARCYAEGRSKALVSRFVGAGDGLSAERHYVTRVLPSGAARALGRAMAGGCPSEFVRAAAIAAGVAVTTAGYLVGSKVHQ